MENKSVKTTPESSDHLIKAEKVLPKNKSCKLKSVKSQPKNTLKDFKASAKMKGLLHRSQHRRVRKSLNLKPRVAT